MKDRALNRAAAVPVCCEAERLRRRRELEDMPMGRIDARGETGSKSCVCLGELTALTREQNRLLCDILGTMNALTAAQLAAAQRKNG